MVERTYGLWKKWAILQDESFFDKDQIIDKSTWCWIVGFVFFFLNLTPKTNISQIHIIYACCVLHNFVGDRQCEMDDVLLDEVDHELVATASEIQDEDNFIRSVSSHEWVERV